MVQPMSAFSGYVTYLQFGLGTEKGVVGGVTSEGEEERFNDVVSDPFVWSPMTEAKSEYTGEKVVESFESAPSKLAWTPCVPGAVKAFKANGDEVTGITVSKDGTLAGTLTDVRKIAYVYDNQIVPQAKLPTLAGKMRGVALTARARRIAVQYSQFAAFQSKNDYGIDFESTIAAQAQSELSYEIDSEAVYMIKKAADAACVAAPGTEVRWIDEEVDTISYSMKAEGFARAIEKAKAVVYKKTNRYMPNWILVSPDLMPIITFVPGFQPAATAVANGPYVAGNIANMKVIVSPALTSDLGEGVTGVAYLGVLQDKAAVGIYAPYLPIIPTNLLQFADGMNSQGFSTMYDMKILNPALLSKITVTTGDGRAAILEKAEI